MPKKKYIEKKKQRFGDATFSMTLFCAKKSKKLFLLGGEKNRNPKIVSKVP